MIIVGGEALIDLILHADGRLVAVPGGVVRTAARTIARLGLRVAFAGGLSTDRFGRQLHERLTADGVDDRFTVRTDRPTTLAVAELDADGTATYRFYTEGTSATAFAAGAVPKLDQRADPIVTAIHVGTLGLVLEPTAGAMEALVAGAPHDALVVLDPNCRPSATPDRAAYVALLDRLLPRVDVVKVSGDDLAFLRPDRSPADAVASLLAAGPGAVLWTDGGGPVHIVTPRGRTTIVPPSIAVVDTVGAGDAFGGGFLGAWIGSGRARAEVASDEALLEATHHAIRVAAFTCTRAGAEPPTAPELAAWTVAG